MKSQKNLVRGVLIVATLAIQGIPLSVYADSSSPTVESKKAPLQIEARTGIKVVAQINSADTTPKGISKQLLGVKNLLDQYTALGMIAGRDFDVAVVFRGDGAQFLLNDQAYYAKVKDAHSNGNPSRQMIEGLHQLGVKIFECQVTMKARGYDNEDLLPFSRVVVSGIGALVDFEKSGYLPINP